MLHRPNFMFIDHKFLEKDSDSEYRFVKGLMLMHFVFIQEEDDTFTVYKNSYDGIEHTGWTYDQCLDLVNTAYEQRNNEVLKYGTEAPAVSLRQVE